MYGLLEINAELVLSDLSYCVKFLEGDEHNQRTLENCHFQLCGEWVRVAVFKRPFAVSVAFWKHHHANLLAEMLSK
jgi:hypothetical protein